MAAVGSASTIRAAGFVRTHRLRAYDAIQPALAQEIHESVPDLVCACFDEQLNQGATFQGRHLRMTPHPQA